MDIIKSKNNPKVKQLVRLKHKKYRNQEQSFLIEGYHLVEEALKHNLVNEIIEEHQSARYKNSILVSREIIEHLSFTQNPQNIVAKCKFIQPKKEINKILVLNNLQDPGNIGTILRLAKAFDIDSVAIENFDFYNDKIIRSSQGALFDLNVFKINNSVDFLINLKNQGFTIYSTVLNQNAQKLQQVNFKNSKIAIVLGNEGQGISKQVQDVCDISVYIPIAFESLNVACCAAIVLNKIYNKG
ncbi:MULTISPECIES: RNA methyltransferase [unclassified Mycoplasma]|uniref:TrmH family RNA methyltransferase n=1 Tax=unclassified Mycoplasma TaxID=2683645 RepID=UPI00211B77F5|nr:MULTISPECIES: RNA methyltransferase [unclassified Mycoplasma]UUM19825.1 RNA methyltransferase [Mycoplasma sp. 1578d]UUM24809.1 RNA methyltransferase [Mycoplasma sp. 3686d]